MGINQSRPADGAIEEKLIERLQALQLKNDVSMNEKEGYVCVENDSGSTRTASEALSRITDLL
jgi:bleomycin hydrolase